MTSNYFVIDNDGLPTWVSSDWRVKLDGDRIFAEDIGIDIPVGPPSTLEELVPVTAAILAGSEEYDEDLTTLVRAAAEYRDEQS